MLGRYGLNPLGRRCTPVPTGCWRRRLMDEVALAGHKVPEIRICQTVPNSGISKGKSPHQ